MEITNELLAAYAEGNVSESERKAVRQYLTDNPEELETVMIMMDDDYDIQLDGNSEMNQGHIFNSELDKLLNEIDSQKLDSTNSSSMNILPMMSMAAKDTVDNLCAIRCEGIALRELGINVCDDDLIKESREEGWIKQEGTALYNIGKLSGKRGLNVAHRYKCSIEDIKKALSDGDAVLAVIDSEELKNSESSTQEGQEHYNPNHVVFITSVLEDEIKLIDSSTSTQEDVYSLSHFEEAWNDSVNYLIIISKNSNYDPHPIDLSDVNISDDLLELREAIAENAHEVWAYNRKKEGWSYGPFRDDDKKLHPDMIAYNRLPESEKEYDREMAMNTIKLVKKLGWEIKKKQ